MANSKTQMLTASGDNALPQFDILKMDSLTFTTSSNVTTINKWYRIATITAAHYPTGLIWLSGVYGGYRPAIALLSFAASGSAVGQLTQLAGGFISGTTQGISKIRLIQITGGVNQYVIEAFYNSTTANGQNSISIACTCEKIALTAPTLADDTPSDGNIIASLSLGAVGTGKIAETQTIPSSNSSSWGYSIFARVPKNSTYNYGTLLVAGYDGIQINGGGGAAIVQVKNYNNAMTMIVTKLAPNTSNIKFGYYDGGDGYWYIGVYTPSYRWTMGVTALMNLSLSARKVNIDDYSYTTTAPTGWTEVPFTSV